MSQSSWWKTRSGAAKTLVIAPLLLVLQIVGLLETQPITLWVDARLHIPGGEEWGTFGLVLWELLFCAANMAVMAIAAMWLATRAIIRRRRGK